jgi:hypothetical protein
MALKGKKGKVKGKKGKVKGIVPAIPKSNPVGIETRVALIDQRKQLMEAQRRINYQNELDRLRGMQDQKVLDPHVLERTAQLKKMLK